MQLLCESKRILAYIGLGNDASVHIGGKSISRLFVRFGYLASLGTCITLHSVIFKQSYEHGLITMLLPISAILTGMSMISIFVNLSMKTEQIHQLFDCLQQAINKSDFFFSF